MTSIPMSGGTFYTNSLTDVLVDPAVPNPTQQSQSKLQVELKRCEALAQRDFRYAHLVAGASKMPMASIWVARNQDEVVNDVDLATFKDLAWTEFVKKRFLSSVSPDTSVASAATSMLEIVRDMNLQRRRFLIMGLHEQVEASELQLVMHLCQANILKGYGHDFKRAALRMRRSDKLFEAFSQAVGAFVCATAPMTLGAGTSRYERDLQYEYKKQMVGLLVYALQQNPRAIAEEEGADEDYVARISRLIVVWQGRPGEQMVVGETRDDGDDKDGGKEAVKQHLIGLSSAIALAQHDAQEARDGAKKVETRVKEFEKQRQTELQLGKVELMARCETMGAGVDAKISNQEIRVQAQVQGMIADNEVHKVWHKSEMEKIQGEWKEHASQLQVNMYGMVRDFFMVGTDGHQNDAQKIVQQAMADYSARLTADIPAVVNGLVTAMGLPDSVDARVSNHLASLKERIDTETARALGDHGLLASISAFVKTHLESAQTMQHIDGYLERQIGGRLGAMDQRVTALGSAFDDRIAGVDQSIQAQSTEMQETEQKMQGGLDALEAKFKAAMDTVDANHTRHVGEIDEYKKAAEMISSSIQSDITKLDARIKGVAKLKGSDLIDFHKRLDGQEKHSADVLQQIRDLDLKLDAVKTDASTKSRRTDDGKLDALRNEFLNDLAKVKAAVDALDTKPVAVLNDTLKTEILAYMQFVMNTVIQQSASTTPPVPADFFSQFHQSSIPSDMMYADATGGPAARGGP